MPYLSLLALALLLQGCAFQVGSTVAGATVGAATGTALAVAKVPFKVGGAVVEAVTGQ